MTKGEMSENRISDAEWSVMQVVWKRGKATAAEVIEELLPDTGWNHRTVRTLLGRLVDKGMLTTRQDGNRYVYKAAISRKRCVREAGNSFLQRVFSGDPAELLVHFVQRSRLSPEEGQRLKRLLNEQLEQDDD